MYLILLFFYTLPLGDAVGRPMEVLRSEIPQKQFNIINGKFFFRELESHNLKCEGYKVIDVDLHEFLRKSPLYR